MLDDDTAALELSNERAEELMSSPGRRRLEVVKDSEVGAAALRSTNVHLRPQPSRSGAARPPHRPGKRAGVHEATR